MIGMENSIKGSSQPELAGDAGFPSQLVVFSIGGLRFGIDIWITERIVPAVEITPLPDLPSIVQGVIKVQDSIIPVVDVRERLNIPKREVELSDRFIIVRTPKRRMALVADFVEGLHHLRNHQIFPLSEILPNLNHIKGIVQLENELVMVNDLDDFLSLDEEMALKKALGE